MNVAIFTPWYVSDEAIGGTERFVQDLALSMFDEGYNVDVYMLSGNSYTKNGVNYISIDLFGKNIVADEYMLFKKYGRFFSDEEYNIFAKEIESKINVDKYDFLQFNSHLFLKCYEKKNRIFTLHSNYEEFKVLGSDDEFKVMIDIMKNAVNYNTYFVSPSDYYQNKWENEIGKNIIYIPHALNKERLICKVDIKKILKKYNLSNNKIKVLLPSRLEFIQKRPELILDSLELFDESKRKCFQIIYTGLDEQYLENIKILKAKAKDLSIDARFVKFDNINEAYKTTDIVLIPSKSESFGYSALESLSLGIPTILSDLPSLREICNGTNNSFIFNDKYSLYEILKEFLENKNFERKEISNEWIKQYDLSLFANRYINIYGKK